MCSLTRAVRPARVAILGARSKLAWNDRLDRWRSLDVRGEGRFAYPPLEKVKSQKRLKRFLPPLSSQVPSYFMTTISCEMALITCAVCLRERIHESPQLIRSDHPREVAPSQLRNSSLEIPRAKNRYHRQDIRSNSVQRAAVLGPSYL